MYRAPCTLINVCMFQLLILCGFKLFLDKVSAPTPPFVAEPLNRILSLYIKDLESCGLLTDSSAVEKVDGCT